MPVLFAQKSSPKSPTVRSLLSLVAAVSIVVTSISLLVIRDRGDVDTTTAPYEDNSVVETLSDIDESVNDFVKTVPSSFFTIEDHTGEPVEGSSEKLYSTELNTLFPTDADPIVAFYADNQSDTDEEDEIHQTVVDYILATEADPVFHAGDLMEDGTADSLNRFNTVTATLRASRSFYAALGNNDREFGDSGTPSQLFLDNFVFPNNEQWYSVNVGNLHLVVLDSAFSADDEIQMNWLSTNLISDDSQERITGVMFHHPTFASTLTQKLIDYGVDFVISGHYHSYSHSISNGIHFFILSGQPSLGYLTAEIFEDSVMMTAYDHDNTVIDRVLFNERSCSLEKCQESAGRELFRYLPLEH